MLRGRALGGFVYSLGFHHHKQAGVNILVCLCTYLVSESCIVQRAVCILNFDKVYQIVPRKGSANLHSPRKQLRVTPVLTTLAFMLFILILVLF